MKDDSQLGCSSMSGDDLSATAMAKSLWKHPNDSSKKNIGMGG